MVLCKFILSVLVWSLQKNNNWAEWHCAGSSNDVERKGRCCYARGSLWRTLGGRWALKMCFEYAHCAPSKRIAIALRRGQASNAPPCRCVLQASCCQPLGQSLDGGSAAWGSKRRLQRMAPTQKIFSTPAILSHICWKHPQNGMTIHGFQLAASHSPQKFVLVKTLRLNITTQTTKTLQNWQKAIYKRQGTKKALQPRVRWENWTNQVSSTCVLLMIVIVALQASQFLLDSHRN